jgi:hypothetical protein
MKLETRIPKYVYNQKHTDYAVTWTSSFAISISLSTYIMQCGEIKT